MMNKRERGGDSYSTSVSCDNMSTIGTWGVWTSQTNIWPIIMYLGR